MRRRIGKGFIIPIAVIFLWVGCWTGNGRAEVAVEEIKARSEELENQFVRVRGYGTIMAEIALCPGYVGLDQRTRFVGEQEETVVAVIGEGVEGEVWAGDTLKVFQGYIRVFQGEIGCPGELRWEKIPYFEITAVE